MCDNRISTVVTIFNGVQYDDDWPTPEYPALLVDAIKWFKGKLDLIPEEYRATAHCEIDSGGGYEGSHYGHIKITYSRPETDEEMNMRILVRPTRGRSSLR